MPTVLVTCFEPFGGDAENASEAAVARLADSWDEPDVSLVTARLPVSFAGSDAALRALLLSRTWDAVLGVGEAGGRTVVTPETTARNLQDARIPDNDGAQPRGTPISPEGPPALTARMDPAALVAACEQAGIGAAVSHDAGGFVCNHVFHRLLQWTDCPAGFVHVPALRRRGVATVGAETDPVTGDVATGAAEVTLEQCAMALGLAVAASLGLALGEGR